MGPHLHPHIPSGAKNITIKIKGKGGSLHELKGFNYEGSSYTYNAVALLGFLGYVSASLVHNVNGDYIYEFQISSSEADKGSIPVTEIDVEGHTRACIALRTLRDYGHSVEWDESSNTVFVDYEEPGDAFKYNWEKEGLPSSEFVTPEFKAKAVEVANKLEINSDDLMSLMAFESWFNPAAKNPGSSATGLIQFLESTAMSLGTTTAALREMTNVQQLDYVYEYLKPFKGRMNNVGDAYLAVFTGGKGIGQSDSFVLYEEGTNSYTVNKGLDADKKGYITRGDAIKAVLDRRELFGLK